MTIEWEEAGGTEWREEFKALKGTISIQEVKLLDHGPQNMKEAWQLGSLHAQYKKLKRNQPPKLPDIKENH